MRPYAGDADLAAVQALLRAHPDPFEYGPDAGDLPAVLDSSASCARYQAAVWIGAAEMLAGFAFVTLDQYPALSFTFAPGALSPDVARALVTWACAQARAHVPQPHAHIRLSVTTRDADAQRRALLTHSGFVSDETAILTMIRSLREAIPHPRLRPGFTIRPFAGENEAPAYLDMLQASTCEDFMSLAARLDLLQLPYYRPDIDLVVMAPDGALAGYCLCLVPDWKNARTGRRDGEINLVGVRPEYRRRGLAQALISAGLHGLQRHGVESAALTVGSWSTPTIRLYRSLGFHMRWATRWYERPIV